MASVVREIVGETIRARVSDPRVSTFASITRVNVSADLAFADVYFSVLGDDAAQRTTLRGLQSARGLIQSALARGLSTRSCPTLRFHADDSIKRGIDTIRRIEELAAGDSGDPAEQAAPPGGDDHEEGR